MNTPLGIGAYALGAPPPLNLNRHALFVDLDGALVEMEDRPEAVRGDEALRRLARRLNVAASGAVAVLTGRTIADADRILGGEIETVAGLHGAEMRTHEGDWPARFSAHAMDPVRTRVRSMIEAGELAARVEDKGGGIALHYRHAPHREAEVHAIARSLAVAHGLRLIRGKFVFELGHSQVNKGSALCYLMDRPPFAGRTPVALGDDITDEDAFVAARDRGGFGVLIGEAQETAALHRLTSVTAVRDWLRAALAGGDE